MTERTVVMAPRIVVDAMDGSRLDGSYLAKCARVASSVVLHVTINNLRRVIPEPTLAEALVDLEGHLRLLDGARASAVLLDSVGAWDQVGRGGVGIVLGYQNASFVASDFELLWLLRRLGVRVVQITHNGMSPFGAGCAVSDGRGISSLGRAFVRHANAAGLLIDCSHASDRLMLDVCEISDRPVLVTHANSSAVFPHRRNRSDTALAAVAATGGVVGVTFYPTLAVWDGEVSPRGIVEHIRHVAAVVGGRAIGFGSDFTHGQDRTGTRFDALRGDGVDVLPPAAPVYAVDDLYGVVDLLPVLRAAGLDDETVLGFAGENFARVLSDNERKG